MGQYPPGQGQYPMMGQQQPVMAQVMGQPYPMVADQPPSYQPTAPPPAESRYAETEMNEYPKKSY
jgi:hypothetical protein